MRWGWRWKWWIGGGDVDQVFVCFSFAHVWISRDEIRRRREEEGFGENWDWGFR